MINVTRMTGTGGVSPGDRGDRNGTVTGLGVEAVDKADRVNSESSSLEHGTGAGMLAMLGKETR